MNVSRLAAVAVCMLELIKFTLSEHSHANNFNSRVRFLAAVKYIVHGCCIVSVNLFVYQFMLG